MNEELLAQIINGMRMNQPQGAVGNVSNNEAAMFSGNPMNGAVAGGNVGNSYLGNFKPTNTTVGGGNLTGYGAQAIQWTEQNWVLIQLI